VGGELPCSRQRDFTNFSASTSGERRLPACESRQLAETLGRFNIDYALDVAGKLPATAGWQPALPDVKPATRADEISDGPLLIVADQRACKPGLSRCRRGRASPG